MIYCIFVILLQSVFVTRSERFWSPVETNMLGAEETYKETPARPQICVLRLIPEDSDDS